MRAQLRRQSFLEIEHRKPSAQQDAKADHKYHCAKHFYYSFVAPPLRGDNLRQIAIAQRCKLAAFREEAVWECAATLCGVARTQAASFTET
jgi:hypothetical protein